MEWSACWLLRVLAAASAAVTLAVGTISPASATAPVTSIRANEWWLPAMHASDAIWPRSTGVGITVAVIDSGVDSNHPDLVGQVLPGQNFSALPGGADSDTDGHGTGMASFIAGTGKGLNGQGMYGLAPAVKILPLRVSGVGDNELTFSTSLSEQLVEAIRSAADSNAQIINISMGQIEDESNVHGAIDYALAKGKLIVSAVGNDGSAGNPLEYPAAFPGVVGVGETTPQSNVATESEHGPQVALVAPGGGMVQDCVGPSGYCTSHGTSDSTAIVSASAALIWSVHPTWTANQIIRVMINTANHANVTPGNTNPYTGYGVVRPRIALVTPGDPGAADVNPLIPVAATQSAASQASAAAATSPNGSALKAGAKTGGDSTSWIVVAIAVVAIILIAVVVALILIRRRNRPGPPPSSDPNPNDPYAHLPG
ncbi:type VII secretion-associated serine protease mycosin [Streptacidiphilus albus]|uniref:type VII secretion-associated serine protease mycosin n=1 Tax=Streptacidiphilus albus TaxID=105425 RepID=UPI0009DFA783|nr:type VII secretion-associated serine protease mycosin [Streptacidiphilus albus]